MAIANGRRRRCFISRLLIDGEVVDDLAVISRHVHDFFASLLTAKPTPVVSISPLLWTSDRQVLARDNSDLMMPLSAEEIEQVVFSSKVNSAPGPDGFSVTLFVKFLAVLKPLVVAIIQGFCLGMVDISRLNY